MRDEKRRTHLPKGHLGIEMEPRLQMFLQQLVSASESLSETEKNLWLDDKLRSLRQQLAVQNGRPV